MNRSEPDSVVDVGLFQARGRFNVDANVTVVCESVRRGCEFRALFYDRVTQQFYGGSGPTALEAVAWCMHEFVRRGVLGRGPRQARNATERPGDGLGGSMPAPSTPAPTSPPDAPRSRVPSTPALAAEESAKDSVGCFERKVPKRAELLLHGQAPRYATSRRRR